MSSNLDNKKSELWSQIKKVENDIEYMEMSLAYGPQSSSGYNAYELRSKELNDKLKILQKNYKALFTVDELALIQEKNAQELSIKKQEQERAEVEKQYLSSIVYNQQRVRVEEANRQQSERLDDSLKKIEDSYKQYISNHIHNKELLKLELGKLDSDWDETTRFGQPSNASYLLKIYTLKRNLLIEVI
jgi:hypothetical protein